MPNQICRLENGKFGVWIQIQDGTENCGEYDTEIQAREAFRTSFKFMNGIDADPPPTTEKTPRKTIGDKRFYILEDLDNIYRETKCLCRISAPVATTRTLHLYEMNSPMCLWQQTGVDMWTLDPRHIYYNDDVFDKYVERIASIRPAVICLGASSIFDANYRPIAPTMPFLERLSSRLLKCCEKLKPLGCKIVSPVLTEYEPTGFLNEERRSQCLSLFNSLSKYLDAVLVDFIQMDKKATVAVSSLINQCYTIRRLPIWVRWSIICSDIPISLCDQNVSMIDAAAKMMRPCFDIIDAAARGAVWFYHGGYQERETARPLVGVDTMMDSNRSIGMLLKHFDGIIASNGRVKSPIIDELSKIMTYA